MLMNDNHIRHLFYFKQIICCGFLMFILFNDAHSQKTQPPSPNYSFTADIHFSKYNFTDLVQNYNGIDGWIEAKRNFWMGKQRNMGFFLSLTPSYMWYLQPRRHSISFDWQRYVQGSAGFQIHPFYQGIDSLRNKWLDGIRVYTWGGYRHYWQNAQARTPYSGYQNWDIQVGADYFVDNLLSPIEKIARKRSAFTYMMWSHVGYHETNFSHKDFNSIFWFGNAKAGPRWRLGKWKRQTLFTYTSLSWSYVAECSCRWWENYGRLGLGAQWYPMTHYFGNDVASNWINRLQVYAQVFPPYSTVWYGDQPPDNVSRWDFQVGIAFSTPGVTRF